MADQNLNSPDTRHELLNPEIKGNLKTFSIKVIIDSIIRIAALSLLFFWCFKILQPFISVVIWATVLAVSFYPVFKAIKRMLYGKNILAAAVLPVIMLSVLIAPAVWMMIATGSELKDFAEQIRDGNFSIPAPDEAVKKFPIIGNRVYDIWFTASSNLEQLITQYRDQIKTLLLTLFALVASTGKGLLLFAASIIVSGFLLAYAPGAAGFTRSVFVRMAGERGLEMTDLAEVTIRNVTRGILGVAFIQAMLAGIGIYMAGVPLAGLWTLACLVLAIVQIGLLPVSLGVIIYIWGAAPTQTAILLTVWMIFVGMVDNILKPFLLGKGAPVPMLIVFLGAIGGFIYSGFIGLFTGAIVLSLAYKLFIRWVNEKEASM